MHILIIPSWYPTVGNPVNGVFFREQAHAIQEAGHKVGVIAPQLLSLVLLPTILSGRLSGIEYEDDRGVPTYRSYQWIWLPLTLYGRAFLWIRAGERLFGRYTADHGMPDVIHAHSALFGGVLAGLIKKKHGIPVVITEHSSRFARKPLRPWQLPLVRSAFHRADERLMVSTQLGTLMEDIIGPHACPWSSVPNLVDGDFSTCIKIDNQRRLKQFCFLNVALMTENKGQADLLRAFASRFKGKEDVQLRIGGSGPVRKKLERLVLELEISGQVTFLGMLSREQVRKEMLAADAFVLSSYYETFGKVLIEALSCGTPVVATACGGPESIVHRGNGLLVPPGDVHALAEAMDVLRRGIGEYHAESISRDCMDRFGREAVLTQLISVYDRACGKTGCRRPALNGGRII